MKCLKCNYNKDIIPPHLICPMCRELMEIENRTHPNSFTSVHKID